MLLHRTFVESAFCHLQAQQLFESKAKWEEQSASKAQWIAQRKQQQEAAAQAEAELLRHRREIAQKLADDQAREMEDLIKQQAAKAGQRRAELAERAQRLQAAREQEQAATRERLLQQQFAAGCDPLRTEQSKRFLHTVVQGRRAQAEKLQMLKDAESEQERAFAGAIEGDRVKQQREMEQSKQRAWEKAQQVAGTLSKQVQEKLSIAAAEEAAHAKEVAAMKAVWAKQEEETKEEERRRKERMHQLRSECEEFNRQKLAEAAAAKATEQAQDAAMLAAALHREREEIAAEQARKAADSRNQHLYRQQLQVSMQHQAQDDARQDEVIERAAKLEAERKQAEADRQAAARAALLAQVVQERQEQIALHERHRLEERCQSTLERSSHEAEVARVEEERRIAKQCEAAAQLRYRQELEAQIAEKQRCRAQDASVKEHERESAVQQEHEIKAKIDAALSAAPSAPYHGRRKIVW
ncbi:probable cilia- and flagella-associated protein 53 [Coccomyxa sp. Obi]|nr:probable cilia- and flagella-associated protein 53 [Coccomyxa sp. Obi]